MLGAAPCAHSGFVQTVGACIARPPEQIQIFAQTQRYNATP